MRSLKKIRRIQLIALAFVGLIGSTALVGCALRDGINYFRAPSQVISDPPKIGEVFRLGGLVEKGSLNRGQGANVTFRVTDGLAVVDVVFNGILPDLFDEGQGMIGTGIYVNNIFQASEILAKHDENYMPKELVESLKKTGFYQDPNTALSIN
ncbi:MAG: cytochrome c maturation protein CcmE [Paracoccaceae bacterium]|jgi:cytochrome c-type biogenesis protein CcmE